MVVFGRRQIVAAERDILALPNHKCSYNLLATQYHLSPGKEMISGMYCSVGKIETARCSTRRIALFGHQITQASATTSDLQPRPNQLGSLFVLSQCAMSASCARHVDRPRNTRMPKLWQNGKKKNGTFSVLEVHASNARKICYGSHVELIN